MIRDTSAQDRRVGPAKTSTQRKLIYAAGALMVIALISWITPSFVRVFSIGQSISESRLRIAVVRRGDLVRDISAQGRVVAAVSPTLYAPASGTISLLAQAGDKVDKEAIIAEIDSPELTNKLAQEQATLQGLELDAERSGIDHRKQQAISQKAIDQAQIDRQTAVREVERTEKAFKLGALPRLDVLRAHDALEKADIVLAHAKKDFVLERESLDFELKTKRLVRDRQRLLVADLQRQVDLLKLRSPVAGQIGQLLVQQKANVAINVPLVTVIDMSAMEIELQVAETFARELAIGMPAEIQNGAEKYPGELSAVSPEVVNGQVVARIRFGDEKPVGLRQNQRLSTRILLDTRQNVLIVERGPFVDAGAGRMAYIVVGDIAERRLIEIGAMSLNTVEMVSGVREGDRIVISGTDEFHGAERVVLSR